MTLSQLALVLFFILLGITWIGWVAISATVLGIIALLVGVLMLLEALGVVAWNGPVIRRRPEA